MSTPPSWCSAQLTFPIPSPTELNRLQAAGCHVPVLPETACDQLIEQESIRRNGQPTDQATSSNAVHSQSIEQAASAAHNQLSKEAAGATHNQLSKLAGSRDSLRQI
jgi:hypothetical protein